MLAFRFIKKLFFRVQSNSHILTLAPFNSALNISFYESLLFELAVKHKYIECQKAERNDVEAANGYTLINEDGKECRYQNMKDERRGYDAAHTGLTPADLYAAAEFSSVYEAVILGCAAHVFTSYADAFPFLLQVKGRRSVFILKGYVSISALRVREHIYQLLSWHACANFYEFHYLLR